MNFPSSMLLTVALIAAVNCPAQNAPVISWEMTLGGSLDDRAEQVIETTELDLLFAGTTYSIDGDMPNNNILGEAWLMKLSQAGQVVWLNTYGGSSLDKAKDVLQTADGGYVVAAETQSSDGDVTSNAGGLDIWVFKLDSSGAIIWEETYGGSAHERVSSIIQSTGGKLIIAGSAFSFDGDVIGNHGGQDFWVLALDQSGTLLWQKTYGGTSHEAPSRIIETSDGGFVIGGTSSSVDGDLTANMGFSDCWVLKIDSVGNLIWQNSFGGGSNEFMSDIVELDNGELVFTGFTNSTDGDLTGSVFTGQDNALWIANLTANGNLNWQGTYGGWGNDYGGKLIQDLNGNILLMGNSDSMDGDLTGLLAKGSGDMWLLSFDLNGNLLSNTLYGGGGYDFEGGICLLANGDLISAGSSWSNDGDVETNRGWNDIWITRLSSDFAQINGTIYADLNSNNVQDPIEQELGSWSVINMNTGIGYFTSSRGRYSGFVLDTGNTSLSPADVSHFTSSPNSRTFYFDSLTQQVDSLNDFAMQPAGAFNDLCVTITPVGFYRPGFPCRYDIDYSNVGTTILTPTVVLFPDPLLTYDSASATATSVSNDSVVWQLPAIAPFQTGHINTHLTLDVNAGLGTGLSSWVRIEQLIGDANVGNNSETWDVITQGSYDPNDILVDQESILFQNMSPVPPDLTYLIRFQNTGTDTAFTVRIENDVPENVDLSTFQFEASSHPVQINYLQHTDRMEYTFNNILLPDSNTNEPLSHGYIRYRIKPKSTLIVGDSVLNDARIYFDFNAPIETNTAITVIETSTLLDEIEINTSIVSPNPTNGAVSISLPIHDHGRIEVFNAHGKMVTSQVFKGKLINVNLEGLSKGVYWISILGEKKQLFEKVVVHK